MRLKYAYYPGCVAKGTCPELDQSTLKIAEKLDIELVELTSANCCGGRVVDDADPDFVLTLNARTFAITEAQNLDVMTICSTCQQVMAEANHRLKNDPNVLSRVNNTLSAVGLQYEGKVKVKHLLEVLVKDYGLSQLSKKVTNPLNNLRVAPFYGCRLLRPREVVEYDEPERPSSLEELIKSLGGQPVDYFGRNKCCGFPILFVKPNVALKVAGMQLKDAKDHVADLIVTPCPLCHLTLDAYQPKVEKVMNTEFSMPILHLPQLVGLALGIQASELGLWRNMVSTETVLKKLEVYPVAK